MILTDRQSLIQIYPNDVTDNPEVYSSVVPNLDPDWEFVFVSRGSNKKALPSWSPIGSWRNDAKWGSPKNHGSHHVTPGPSPVGGTVE